MTFVTRNGFNFYFKQEGKVGIILFHEVYGLDSYITNVADKLSEKGYSVTAPDLYQGKRASSLDEALLLRKEVTCDKLNKVAEQALNIFREFGVKKLGSMGFCMGGGFALHVACKFSLDFCVDFYGMMENEEEIEKIKGPLLLILASNDQRVNSWVFQKLLPSASKYQKKVELHIYPNTVHAFHRPGWQGYDKNAADDAWNRTLNFLASLR
jgi:carboxymethylenebutenolidase